MMTEQVQTATPELALTPFEGFRILMPLGIIGFPNLRHYMLKPVLSEEKNTAFWRFESQDHKEITFILLESGALAERVTVDSYKIEEALGTVNAMAVNTEIFYVVTLETAEDGSKQATVNVRAPIVINPETSEAWQVILQDSDYPIDYVL